MRMKISQTSQWQTKKNRTKYIKWYFDLISHTRVSQANGRAGTKNRTKQTKPYFSLVNY